MKKTLLLLFLCITCLTSAQSAGDILFIGFNADGDKDFAIVAMQDLQANTIIYFTDNEPNTDGNGNSGTSEGVLQWDTGSSVISAGTVVTFTDVDSVGNANFGASVGVLTYPDAGFNISSSGDAIYATYGDPSDNTVTTWISGLQNMATLETNFSATGLSTASNFVVIDITASKDGGEFKTSLRSGQTVSGFSQLIVDDANWDTSTTDGESFIPFDTASFTFSTLSVEQLEVEDIELLVNNNKIESSNGTVLRVLNILGQEVVNKNISKGVYLVLVKLNNGSLESFKIMI